MLKRSLGILISLFILSNSSYAGEGMWLPMLIKKMNYADMQEKGLQLTAEDLYSINNSSIKDAIVGLGRPDWNFCSGEIVSSKGLFLTNHHCGYSAIQSLSDADHDYLRDGYWAMSPDEEKPAGFSVHIMQRMDDVTSVILDGIDYETTEEERAKLVKERTDSLIKIAEEEEHITAIVKSFYKGNEYYIFHFKVYPDVRFVGAPPSAIGKFGFDTDNWVWPRHTGDFSMFRIYTDKDNNPAEFSEDNVPFTPDHYLPISLKGVELEDYAMIMGFPGSTDRFLTSYGVQLAVDIDQPSRVKIRRKKLDIYEAGMAQSDSTRLKYAAKQSGVSNYWKYFVGQTRGLKRLKVYDKKKAEEDAFEAWVNENEERKATYGNVIPEYAKAYSELSKYKLASNYLGEAIYGVEILRFSRSFNSIESLLSADDLDQENLDKTVAALRSGLDDYYSDYDAGIDQEVLASMLQYYYEDVPKDQQPEYFTALVKKNKYDFNKIAATVFDKSIFAKKSRVNAFLDKPNLKKLQSDPAYEMFQEFMDKYNTVIKPNVVEIYTSLDKTGRLYIDGLRKMNPEKNYYPDANSTLRITYGQVLDYDPMDAVHYDYLTTLNGVMEKEDPNNFEFNVPEKLKELYEKKDYGRYGEDGDLVVCFISNNDITGGNSGSAVINGNGELIGTAFDGNWEAMSGDIAFEPELQRTISVDIRYTLFIIDKFSGAGYLIDEMKLVEEKEEAEVMK